MSRLTGNEVEVWQMVVAKQQHRETHSSCSRWLGWALPRGPGG